MGYGKIATPPICESATDMPASFQIESFMVCITAQNTSIASPSSFQIHAFPPDADPFLSS